VPYFRNFGYHVNKSTKRSIPKQQIFFVFIYLAMFCCSDAVENNWPKRRRRLFLLIALYCI